MKGTSTKITVGGLVIALLLAIAPSAWAVDLGAISGTIREQGSLDPLAGCAYAYDTTNPVEPAAAVCADGTGAYEISSLPVGTYRVLVIESQHAQRWYDANTTNGATTYDAASDVQVTTDPATSDETDVDLPDGSTITGNITAAGAGALVDGAACVNVWLPPEGDEGWPRWINGDCTDGVGDYSVGGLTPSTDYYVNFYSGEYKHEWHSNASHWTNATLVQAGGADVDAQLVAGVKVTGTILGAGEAVDASPTFCLNVYETGHTDNDWWDYWAGNTCGVNSTTGAFEIGSLAPGTYKLQVWDYTGEYKSEWFNATTDGSSFYSDADDLAITEEDSPLELSEAIQLETGAKIAGVIKETTGGSPAVIADPNICVQAYELGGGDNNWWELWAGGTCDVNDTTGAFVIGGLNPGQQYKIQAHDRSGDHKHEWWSNVADYSDATPVTATAGTTNLASDMVLDEAAAISGQVRDSGGAVITDPTVCINAYETGGSGDDYWNGWAGGTCDVDPATGAFVVGGLDTGGSYKVEFFDYQGDHKSEWYDNKASYELAASVTAPATAPAPILLAKGAKITGVVKDAGGFIDNPTVCVNAFQSGSGENDWWTRYSGGTCNIDADDGSFTLGGLNNGQAYKLSFYDYSGSHKEEWFNGKSDYMTANEVTATEAGTALSAEVILADGVKIRGSVVDSLGDGVDTACVNAYGSGGGEFDYHERWASGTCDIAGDGGFTLGGLEPNSDYKVEAWDRSGNHKVTWFHTGTDAGDNYLTATAHTSGASGESALAEDIVMPEGAKITGNVLDENSDPITSTCVRAFEVGAGQFDYWDKWAGGTCDIDGTDGSFTLGGLDDEGVYRLEFEDYSGDHKREWWNNKTTYLTADAITVDSDQPFDLPSDVVMLSGVKITGIVEDDAGNPIETVCVDAFRTGGSGFDYWDEWAGSTCDFDSTTGAFTLGGLDANTDYKLHFFDYEGLHQDSWFDGQDSYDSATIVTSPASGSQALGSTVVLSEGTFISGTLEDEEGNPVHACVTLFDEPDPDESLDNDDFVGGTCDPGAGDFMLGGISPGTYYLQVGDEWNDPDFVITEWYQDVPNFDDWETGEVLATPVTVTMAGRDDIDFVVDIGGSISGTLSDTGSDPINDMCFDLFHGSNGEWITGGCQWDTDGSYRLDQPVPAGQYKVRFYDGGFAHGWAWEWSGDALTYGTASAVTVARGAMTDLDATLEQGGTITGNISAPGATTDYLQDNVCVGAFLPNEDPVLPSGFYDASHYDCADASGNFSLGGLRPGQPYKLLGVDFGPDFAEEWYDDQPDFANGVTKTVTSGGTTALENSIVLSEAI